MSVSIWGLFVLLGVAPSGQWELVSGRGPGVADYAGQLTVEPRGFSYLLRWDTTEGEFSGVGMQAGQRLVAGWGTGRGYGLGVFEIRRDGTLLGRWTEPAAVGMQGRETWIPLDPERGLSGAYRVEGSLPALGGNYEGMLEVKEVDGAYRLTWSVLEETYLGIGVVRGRRLFVAWGPPEGAGLAVYRVHKRRARGRWIRVDGVGWGTERLRR
ncbi:MAG: hypothetical protein VX519_01185 [Myxococcota bacterium]|nr:hypothetical protein [Myxococcota bacterium]